MKLSLLPLQNSQRVEHLRWILYTNGSFLRDPFFIFQPVTLKRNAFSIREIQSITFYAAVKEVFSELYPKGREIAEEFLKTD